MNKKAPIIFSIILLSILIFFLVMFLVVYLTGGKFGRIKLGNKSTKVIFENTFKLTDIEKIDIKQDAGNVIFRETSNKEIQIIAYGENENDVNVSINNNTLVIDYTEQNKFLFFNFGGIKNDIIIYIPSNYSNEIKIKNSFGNCEIVDLDSATIDIDCDAGNVETGAVKNAKIKCDLGAVKIKEILNKCDIKVDSGDIEIEKLSIKENSKIKADLGNVDINEVNDIYIDASVDLGKAYIENNNRNANVTLKIECDCGNINVGK